MEQRKKNNLSDLLMIHGAVLLFGLAGVISKGITTGSMMITFGRVFFLRAALGLSSSHCAPFWRHFSSK